jgi:hypothetical protein
LLFDPDFDFDSDFDPDSDLDWINSSISALKYRNTAEKKNKASPSADSPVSEKPQTSDAEKAGQERQLG